MSKEYKPNILLNSKIAVGIVIAILFVLGLALIAQGFIDTRNYRDQIIQAIQEQTHRTVNIKGAVSVSLLPVPTLYISGLELRDSDNESPAPSATVNLIRIRVPVMSVFSDHPRISAITLEQPTLELVRAEDHLIHWDWLNAGLLKALADNKDPDNALEMEVLNGKILYHDISTDRIVTLDNINAVASNRNRLYVDGSFMSFGHDLKFSMNTDPVSQQASAGATPFEFKMYSSDKSTLSFKGDLDLAKELPEVKGTVALDLQDVLSWTQAKAQEEGHLLQKMTKMAKKKEEKTLLPLKMSAEWMQQGLSVALNNVQLEGLDSTGTGNLKLSWHDWRPVIAADMTFSALNYEQWAFAASQAFARTEEMSYARIYHTDDDGRQNLLPKDIELSLNLVADQLYVGAQSWKNVKVGVSMVDASVTVNQFNIELPGDSTLTLFGVISSSATNDLRFEGSMETQGKSLRNMLTVFDESAANLPETGFGAFFSHSNIFVSSTQLRLSEADVKLGDLHLTGGLVAYFDANPRIEADVKLKEINFDYFRDVWRDKVNKSGQQDFFLKYDKNMNFNWLRKLQTTIDFRVNVENFTFLERKGSNAAFRLYARSGEFGIYDINFIYPTDIMKGTFKLDAHGEQPAINLALNVAELNSDYFSSTPAPRPVVEEPKPDAVLPPEGAAASEDPEEKKDREEAAKKVADAAKEAEEKAKKDMDKKLRDALGPALDKIPKKPTPKLEVKPQSEIYVVAADEPPPQPIMAPPRPAADLEDLVKKKAKGEMTSPLAQRWSEELIDMSWLNGISGSVDLTVGKMVHKEVVLGNVRLQATFGNDLMSFKTFTFNYWGGQCSIAGSMYGGKVPGLSVSMTLLEAHIQDILKSLFDRENVTGNVSISATLATSGINFLSWIQQAEGKMVVIGRGVTVQGFNLPGVVDAVAISRTASDVTNSVTLALDNGMTTFAVDGNINIKNGMLRTPGMSLKADTVPGNLMGEVRLIPWTMDLYAMFQFPDMSTETVPTMTVQVIGPLNNAAMTSDTSSLEAYVAKRIISK